MTQTHLTKTLLGAIPKIPPIWFMRQAGRHLAEYREIRAKAGSFMDLCYNPELAAEVTLQPIRRYDIDAAIVFADILLIPDGMGQKLSFMAGEGPKLEPALTEDTIESLSLEHVMTKVAPMFETLERVRAELPNEKSLIGFAGAPWTVATYMIAGKGTKDPSALRSFAYKHPEIFEKLMDMLTQSTIDYLLQQIKSGADTVQLFDSWASGLPEAFFKKACLEPSIKIAKAIKKIHPEVPFIIFPRGAGPLLSLYKNETVFDAIAIDTAMPWDWARTHLSPEKTVQGGLDPLLVVTGGRPMIENAMRLKETFDGAPYVFNLGHGFDPSTPPEHVSTLVKAIRS